MLVITAPGQGAQVRGFLAPWLELPGAVELMGRWSELAGIDLIGMGTTAGTDEITDTAVAQPLLVAAALLAAEQLPGPDIAAGHSVGELAAGAIAGVVAPDDAIWLSGVRSRAMAQATRALPTGMTAVLGGDADVILKAIAACGLVPANVNARDQIVAAGTLAQLDAFAASPPPGARLRRLNVAGAFHTAHMAAAARTLAAESSGLAVRDPSIRLLSNRDGDVVKSGQDWLNRIVAQVAASVRWDQCMTAMARLGATLLVELPPARTLTGLARRALPAVQAVALKEPSQLDDVRERIAEDRAEHGELLSKLAYTTRPADAPCRRALPTRPADARNFTI
jgi:[acyl-carrier-protein] S-malonyltransferase